MSEEKFFNVKQKTKKNYNFDRATIIAPYECIINCSE